MICALLAVELGVFLRFFVIVLNRDFVIFLSDLEWQAAASHRESV